MTSRIAPNVLKAPTALAAASVLIIGLALHAAQAHAMGAVSPAAATASIVQDKVDPVPLGVMLFVHRPGVVPAAVPAPDTRAERCRMGGTGDCDREAA